MNVILADGGLGRLLFCSCCLQTCLLGLIPCGDHSMVDVSPWGNHCKKKIKKSRSWISKTGRKRKKGKKKTPKFAVACLFYNSSRLLSLDRHAGLMAAAQGLIFKLPQTPVAPINEAAGWVREARWEHNSILLVVLTDSVLWGWIWRACAKWLCR